MGLKDYGRKRNFDRTPEPRPDSGSKAADTRRGRLFVIQKHAATHTHYDLRLEIGGVLKSWAVPKGPSFDPRDRRLAVHVEDHPLEYGSFEGTIPEGQYGGGAVMLWDRGRWSPVEDDAQRAYDAGKLKFSVEGERMRGRWMLVRTSTGRSTKRGGREQDHWLLFKERDAEASPGLSAEAFPTSVATGRTMEEIAAGAPVKPVRAAAPPALSASGLPGARAAEMPRSLRPQLGTASEHAPTGAGWLHEVKFDGYRLLVFRRGDSVRLISRNGQDWTKKLPDLAAAVRERVRADAVLDGEAVVLDRRGISDFQALQNAMQGRRAGSIVYMVFDLPWCDGHDLTRVPLEQRRRMLTDLVGTRQEGRLRLSEALEGNGPAVFRTACEHGLEGIVSKRLDSAYSPGRSPAWLKVKCFNTQEFVVGGWTAPEGARQELGALLLGYYDEAGELVYAGKVGSGFSSESLRRLGAELRPLVRARPAFVNPPTGSDARGVTWTRPQLVAAVRFRDWTGEGIIRHPSFRGLRRDMDPKDVRRQPDAAPRSGSTNPAPPEAVRKPVSTSGAPTREAPAPPLRAAVRLTHADRVVYPDRGAGYSVTKGHLAAYYEAVAERMLPHVAGRPLSVVRCPDGEGGQCFFQKHRAAGMPRAIHGCPVVDEKGEASSCLLIRDLEGLLGLVQINALEIHPWGSPVDDPEKPDRIILDLDPGPGVPWRGLVEAAFMLREALRQIGLTPFARTTGGKGLHVVVPIQQRYTWDQARTFSKGVAEAFVRLAPRRFVAVAAKAQREGRIYIDHLRNGRGATAIAPYSTRARPGAPVAAPVFWDELAPEMDPRAFNVQSMPPRLASLARDPWEDLDASAGTLPL